MSKIAAEERYVTDLSVKLWLQDVCAGPSRLEEATKKTVEI